MDSRPPAFNPNYPGPPQVPGYPAGTKPAYTNPYPNLPGFNQPIYPDGNVHPSVTHPSVSAPPPPYTSVTSVNSSALPPGYPVDTPSYRPVNPTLPSYTTPLYQPVYPPTQPYPPYAAWPNMGVAPPAGFVNVMPVMPSQACGPACGPVSAPYPNLQSYTPGFVGFVFQPTPAELKARKMIVQYNTSADCYVRPKDSSNTGNLAGWSSCIYQQRNIYRKEEHDWQKVYLARDVGTDFASIEWRFDLSRVARRVGQLKVTFGTKTYKSGSVTAYVISDGGLRREIPNNVSSFKIKEADGWERFSIIAELRGGEGADAWQHTQLFRQPKAIMMNNCPFHVSVKI